MLDRVSLKLLSPVISGVARTLNRAGFKANHLTVLALVLGLSSAALIAMQAYWFALALLLLSRFCDALDGAIARLNHPTDLGAYLDIVCDFIFYASIPLAFAWANPFQNALAAATLLAAFIGTGVCFLTFAIFAQKRGLSNDTSSATAQQNSKGYYAKGFYYLGGLTEGTETILVFCAMLIWPAWFSFLAMVFAALCAITVATRIKAAIQILR
jgi:phosphatidylglycerophosphate synthase